MSAMKKKKARGRGLRPANVFWEVLTDKVTYEQRPKWRAESASSGCVCVCACVCWRGEVPTLLSRETLPPVSTHCEATIILSFRLWEGTGGVLGQVFYAQWNCRNRPWRSSLNTATIAVTSYLAMSLGIWGKFWWGRARTNERGCIWK